MLRHALFFLALFAAVLSSGCEDKVELSTDPTRAAGGEVELQVVNSFIDEMEVTILACAQQARIDPKTTVLVECPLEEATPPFEVIIAWPDAPLDEQGDALFPPQIVTVAAGQAIRIGIAPEGAKGGFRVRVVER